MSRVLVTGGAGFIGSHVADQLAELGHDVIVLDRAVAEGHEQLVADIRDADAVARVLRGVDHVTHQASMVGLGLNFDDVDAYVAHNDLGTAVLLRELARARFAGRLVLASSMVVYGEGRYVCERHGGVRPGPRALGDLSAGRFDPLCPGCGAPLQPAAISEQAPVDPRNVYAATKLHQEHLCQAFARETGVAVTALRYHNVYGPRMPRDTPYAGVAALFASALATGRPPQIYEDGGQLRDFVHVRDVARANVLALTNADPCPGAFNVCSGTPRSVGELAWALHAGHAAAPDPEVTGQFRGGDVRHVFADPSAAREVLGFAAEILFADGMAEFASSGTAPARDV